MTILIACSVAPIASFCTVSRLGLWGELGCVLHIVMFMLLATITLYYVIKFLFETKHKGVFTNTLNAVLSRSQPFKKLTICVLHGQILNDVFDVVTIRQNYLFIAFLSTSIAIHGQT